MMLKKRIFSETEEHFKIFVYIKKKVKFVNVLTMKR